MAFYLGPGGAGDATGDASSQAVLATQKAAEAAASASSALSSQATAATASVNAVTAASNASTSATNAASSVSSISALASAAAASATTATTKAAESAASASTSGTSASSAATQATAASSSASSASTSASNASTSASGAYSSASSASSYATTATTKASESSTSATNASNSAASAASSAAMFTDSYIRSKFSAVGSLSYDSATGIFSYTPASGTAGSFSTLTTSSTVTHNGGTANGVTYLNGSKVLTTGSALTFDGTRLTSPLLTTSGNGNNIFNAIAHAASQTPAGLTIQSGGGFFTDFQLGADVSGFPYTVINQRGNGSIQFNTNNTERMRVDAAGNLGIGTSAPGAKLDVVGSAQVLNTVTAQNFLGNAIDLTIRPLAQTSAQTGGTLYLQGAAVNNTSASTNSGRVYVSGGASTAPSTAAGGPVAMIGGTSANGAGGSVTLQGGVGYTAGGAVTIASGADNTLAPGNSGNVSIYTPAGSVASGTLTLAAGGTTPMITLNGTSQNVTINPSNLFTVTSGAVGSINNVTVGATTSATGKFTTLRAAAYLETKITMSANAIDLATGNYFSKTISGATTFTVSNVSTTGIANSFILDLTNGGSSAITWFSGVKWIAGTAPTLTAAGRDALGFFTHDGGTTWTGLVLGKDIK